MMEFTYKKYREILKNLQLENYEFSSFVNYKKNNKEEKIVYLRHDIDISMEKIVEMANIENELGISSTWYIMPNNKLYNLEDENVRKIIEKLKNEGHSIGLHIDASKYKTQDEMKKDILSKYKYYKNIIPLDKTISFHVPNDKILSGDLKIDGFVNAYEKIFFDDLCYVSDSNQRPFLEQERFYEGIKNNQSFQLLIHPIWWDKITKDKESIEKTLEAEIDKKLQISLDECKWDENPYEISFEGVSSIVEPKDNSLIFCNKKYYNNYKENLNSVKNCVILLPNDLDEKIKLKDNTILYVDNPRLAFAKLLQKKYKKTTFEISPNAIISKDAIIGENVNIEDFVVIEKNVVIKDNVNIKSGTKILENTIIEDNCNIGSNCVLGADGLAYEYDEENNCYQKFPQIGGVIIKENVDIGSNTTIAKGAIVNTILGQGCKIDNNCFISHNVNLGENVLVVGNTIIMGSVKVGDNSYISGGCTIRDNIELGDNSFIGMGSVVTKDINQNEEVVGVPAKKLVRNK